jgi:hypothetical protein
VLVVRMLLVALNAQRAVKTLRSLYHPAPSLAPKLLFHCFSIGESALEIQMEPSAWFPEPLEM